MISSNRLLSLLPEEYKLGLSLKAGSDPDSAVSGFLKNLEALTESELVRWVCQNNFLAFCIVMKANSAQPFLPTKFHTLLANKLQDIYEAVAAGLDQRVITEVQPQIGKSTMVSELFPAWVLGKQQWPIIVASYGATLAEQKSQNCREIVNSIAYQVVFPHVRIDPDTSAKEFWKTQWWNARTQRYDVAGYYKASGVGGPLTGMQGKLLITDDPFKDQADADSETIRESSMRWFKSVFMTRRQSRTGVIIVNTRWHLDDITGRLLEEQEQAVEAKLPETQYDQWQRLRFPAFAEEDEYFDGVLFRKQGDVLCPERFTYEDMIKTRNSTPIEQWSALYMQSPILNENAEFKAEWFKYYDPLDETVYPQDLVWTTTVDPAISQSKRADNSVIRSVGKSPRFPQWYLGEETAGKLDPLQLIDGMFYHHKLYRSRQFVEAIAYQKSIQYYTKEEMRKRQEYFDINEVKRTTVQSKEARIRGLIPLYKAGVIYHRKGLDSELERELLQFPKGRHDDRIDALAMHLEITPPTRKNSVVSEERRPAFDKFKAIGTI